MSNAKEGSLYSLPNAPERRNEEMCKVKKVDGRTAKRLGGLTQTELQLHGQTKKKECFPLFPVVATGVQYSSALPEKQRSLYI